MVFINFLWMTWPDLLISINISNLQWAVLHCLWMYFWRCLRMATMVYPLVSWNFLILIAEYQLANRILRLTVALFISWFVYLYNYTAFFSYSNCLSAQMELHRIKKLLILTETTTYVIPWCITFVTISTRIFHVSIQILAYFHNLKSFT